MPNDQPNGQSNIPSTALTNLRKGQRAVICDYSDESQPLVLRLMEMGATQGTEIRVVHTGPLGGNPLAIEIRGSVIALRRQEASQILVKEISA